MGSDKIFVAESNLFLYRTARRELVKLEPNGVGVPPGAHVTSVVGSLDVEPRLWFAVQDKNQQSKVLEITLEDAGDQYSAEDITSDAVAKESITSLAAGPEKLWAATKNGRLFEFDGRKWV